MSADSDELAAVLNRLRLRLDSELGLGDLDSDLPDGGLELDDEDLDVGAHAPADEDEDEDMDAASPGGESPHRARTQSYRAFHKARNTLADAVRSVLQYMRDQHLDLPLLLWAISYYVPELVTDELAKFERVALLSSYELPALLKCWHKPPRSHSRGTRSKGASASINQFVLDHVGATLQREINSVGAYMKTSPEDLSEEELLAIKFSEVQTEVQARAPTLWRLLRQCAWSPRQEKENTLKSPDKPVLYMIAMASFTRSNRNNRLQRLMSIYLKSCGTSAKAFDTLHACGFSMSQKWTYGSLELLSHRAQENLRGDMEVYPWFGSHDNVNFRFRVFEQRSDHHSHFDSGTAGAIYIIKDPSVIPPDPSAYYARRAEGSQHSNLITPSEILHLEEKAAPRLSVRARDVILQILLGTPEFGLRTYADKDSSALQPAPRPGQLDVNAEPSVTQYVLDTVHLEEASYEGNVRVMREWLRQLRYNTPEKQKLLGKEKPPVPWVGDQLTASRLRGIQDFRCDDFNGYERMQWLVPTFGWFHLVFAVEHSLHAQYYGTRAGLGLVHAFEIMDRRGLQSTSTQGTFHHTFEEALCHTLEARIRDLWCQVGKVESLAELRTRTPQELCMLATTIYEDYASSLALSPPALSGSGDAPPAARKPSSDPFVRQSIMFVRDVLDYWILRDAIGCGDVQTMEDLLPRLLLRFLGGGNKNYAIEICELLQSTQKEWPDDLKRAANFIKKYCWVLKTHGHKEQFIALDRVMEYCVKNVKFSFAASGPFSTWDYIGKTSASIPCQRNVKDHVESEFNCGWRGKSHTSPDKEADIAKLQKVYRDSHAHASVTTRTLATKDKFADTMEKGGNALLTGKAFKRWGTYRVERRDMSGVEDWESLDN